MRRPSMAALFRFWVGGLRKPLAALFLSVAILGGGAAAWATAAAQTTITYFSIAAAGLGVISARPRQIGPARTAQDGTVFRDYDNGKTLITHIDGSWSVANSRQQGLRVT
jgi:hypothetical protein